MIQAYFGVREYNNINTVENIDHLHLNSFIQRVLDLFTKCKGKFLIKNCQSAEYDKVINSK